MYENGYRVNGFRKKRLHKRKMQQRHIDSWFYGDGSPGAMSWNAFKAYVEKTANEGYPVSDALEYWKTYYASGRRQQAKRETARRSRQEFREAVNKCVDFDEFDGLTAYHRMYDYAWEVW